MELLSLGCSAQQLSSGNQTDAGQEPKRLGHFYISFSLRSSLDFPSLDGHPP